MGLATWLRALLDDVDEDSASRPVSGDAWSGRRRLMLADASLLRRQLLVASE